MTVRYRVALKSLLPGYLRRNRWYLVMLPTTFFILLMALLLASPRLTVIDALILTPVVLLVSIGLSVLFWPFRLLRNRTASIDYYLRYREANRTQVVRASDSMADVPTGGFALDCLRSLAVTEDDSFPGNRNLVFHGQHTMASLTRWPGVSPEDAVAIRDAVLNRVEAER